MTVADIHITHPDKLIFPKLEIRKRELVHYYDKIADRMLPYLKDRPLTIQRFPDGIGKKGFYQKHAQEYYPEFIERIQVRTREGEAEEIMVNNKQSLVYLANQGAIALHIWLSRKGQLERPDKVIFDLDPSDNQFEKVIKGAKLLKKKLEKEGIAPRLMTTGKRGLHVWYERKPGPGFDEVRKEARQLAQELTEKHHDLFTMETRKEKRGNKLFLDVLRNAYAQTGICPFSLRAIESAGVATPLEWKELSRVASGDHYTYQNIFRRLGAKGT